MPLEGLIGEKELEMVKRGVIFVSTISREVVDERAMAKAIEKKGSSPKVMGRGLTCHSEIESRFGSFESF